MQINPRTNCRKGFNLLETLVASTLLAGAVMTIATLSGRCLSAVRVDQKTETAWELADMQLKFIDATGVRQFLELGQTSGIFEQMPEYQWTVLIEEMEIQDLFDIQVQIQWIDGQRSRQIECQTRLCDPLEDTAQMQMDQAAVGQGGRG